MGYRRRRFRVDPLTRAISVKILDFLFLTPVRIVKYLVQKHQENYEEYDDDAEEEEIDFDPQDCPEFIQIININKETVIGIEKVIWCPDETVLLRVLTETDVSKPYKKKVYYLKKERYIKLGAEKIYLK